MAATSESNAVRQVSAGQVTAGQLSAGEVPAGQVSATQVPAEHSLAVPALTGPPAIRLRPLAVADLPQVSRWFAAPHVERWWHESSDLAAVRSHYLPCIDGSEPAHLLIAELPSGPFGLAQWYRWNDYPDHAHSLGASADEAGFDYLIGSADLCGQGVGTRLIAMLVDHIRAQDATVAGFVVDPEVANIASRRCWRRTASSWSP